MKMSNGVHTIECIEFVKNVWERDGFTEVVEEESELTYSELKTLAKEKGINTHGMKKEEIVEAIESLE